MPAVVAAILQNQAPPIDSVRSGLPRGLSAVIERCMQTKPDARFQSVAAVAAALVPFGSTSDQRSAERIARVLGIVTPLDETLPPDTELAPRQPSENAGPVAYEKTQLLADAPRGQPEQTTGVRSELAASVAQGVVRAVEPEATPSMQAATTQRSRRSLGLVGLVVLLAGGGAYAAFGRSSPPPGAGVIASAPELPSTPPPPAASSAPLATVTASSSPALPSAEPSARANIPVIAKTAPVVRPTASATVTASATPPPKNPLDMGIK
jgi:serine/threonine-protein kinase